MNEPLYLTAIVVSLLALAIYWLWRYGTYYLAPGYYNQRLKRQYDKNQTKRDLKRSKSPVVIYSVCGDESTQMLIRPCHSGLPKGDIGKSAGFPDFSDWQKCAEFDSLYVVLKLTRKENTSVSTLLILERNKLIRRHQRLLNAVGVRSGAKHLEVTKEILSEAGIRPGELESVVLIPLSEYRKYFGGEYSKMFYRVREKASVLDKGRFRRRGFQYLY